MSCLNNNVLFYRRIEQRKRELKKIKFIHLSMYYIKKFNKIYLSFQYANFTRKSYPYEENQNEI